MHRVPAPRRRSGSWIYLPLRLRQRALIVSPPKPENDDVAGDRGVGGRESPQGNPDLLVESGRRNQRDNDWGRGSDRVELRLRTSGMWPPPTWCSEHARRQVGDWTRRRDRPRLAHRAARSHNTTGGAPAHHVGRGRRKALAKQGCSARAGRAPRRGGSSR